ncbi:hypothetical protein H0Z60_05915 [Ectothiorhodospiraceae bacterium WFHF3C12]|nr:hypothetical protein [Ectothiorhodospiraceae bacterium WFHF3C12]
MLIRPATALRPFLALATLTLSLLLGGCGLTPAVDSDAARHEYTANADYEDAWAAATTVMEQRGYPDARVHHRERQEHYHIPNRGSQAVTERLSTIEAQASDGRLVALTVQETHEVRKSHGDEDMTMVPRVTIIAGGPESRYHPDENAAAMAGTLERMNIVVPRWLDNLLRLGG